MKVRLAYGERKLLRLKANARRTRRYGRLRFTGAGLRGGVGMRGSGGGGADRVPVRSPLRTLAALI